MRRVKSKYPIDSSGLSEKLKSLRLDKDENNDLPALPIIPFNVLSNPSTSTMPCEIVGTFSGTGAPIGKAWLISPGVDGVNFVGLGAASAQYVYNPLLAAAEFVRTPIAFKSVQCNTAAATTVWDPAAGKKFRILGGVITTSGWLAAAAETVVTLLDNVTATGLAFNFVLPAAATALSASIPFDLKPNGYLSIAADNNLNVTLTANLTGGHVMVTVWGTEE